MKFGYMWLGLVLFTASACASLTLPPTPLERTRLIARGHDLAEQHCSSCHAIAAEGDSPAEAAPTFREVHDRFNARSLNGLLSQGISHAHPAMPGFEFNDQDARALDAYLRSVQQTDERDHHQP